MRGQAFVIFNEVTSATNALRSMQGFPFYDKPMRIQYAKGHSDIIAKRLGTYVERPKQPTLDAKEYLASLAARKKMKKESEAAVIDSSDPAATAEFKTNGAINAAIAASVNNIDTPNKILFVIDLPTETSQATLQMLFQPFSGFKEIRLVPSRSDIAFVEFENEMQATLAKDALQGFKITPTNTLKISYAKRA